MTGVTDIDAHDPASGNRRQGFVWRRWLLCVLLPAVLLPPASAGREPLPEDEYAALHWEAKWRHRRIIQNNDGGESRVPSAPVSGPGELLSFRASPLLGSQVDTIIYDTTAGTFGRFSHATEATEPFLVTEGRYRYNVLPGFLEQGTDPLQVMIDFARDKGIEILWTVRVNDTHDTSNPLVLSQLKKDHPEWLMSAQGPPRHGNPTAVHYGREEIRESLFRVIQEVAWRYDVDGIHLDFTRNPLFFRSVVAGERTATQPERAQLTEMLRRIREETIKAARARGKPLLLWIKVQDSVDFCQDVGIDLETWLREELVDVLTTTCFMRLNPWTYSVELGRTYGLPVYPSLSESRVATGSDPFSARHTPAVYRARAAQLWQAGADGVYLFNAFNPHRSYWSEMGSPATLAGLDKRYFVSCRGAVWTPSHYLTSDKNYVHITNLTPDQPVLLTERGQTVLFPVQVAEDFVEAARKGRVPTVTLRMNVHPFDEPATFRVTLNGVFLEVAGGAGGWIEYPVQPGALKWGENQVAVSFREEAGVARLLDIDYPAPRGRGIGITRLRVEAPAGANELVLYAEAAGSGGMTPGSLSIRTPERAPANAVPPGFQVGPGDYVYPQSWLSPGYRFEDAEGDSNGVVRSVEVRLPIPPGPAALHALRVIATTRPLDLPFARDDRFFSFRIDEQGALSLPAQVNDLHLDVVYAAP